MIQTDYTTKVPGYISNKYTILLDDTFVTQSNYHFPNGITEVYTTGWPPFKCLGSLPAVIAVWRIKERKQLA